MLDFKEKANLIWKVADLLRGDYKRSDYGKVILPMTVLRRLDCVLSPSKQKVLDYLPRVENLSDAAKDLTLNKIAGFNFHNRSLYDFSKIVSDPNNVSANLRNFTKYFYEFKPLRPLADIRREILELELETVKSVQQIL